MARSFGALPPPLALVGAAACWGTATAVAKRAVDEIAPLTLLPIELAVSVAALASVIAVTRPRFNWSPELHKLAWLGVLNPGVSYALSLAGLSRITASTSVLLWAVEPVVIIALARLVLKERIPLAVACAATVALAGVVLVVFQPGTGGSATGTALTLAGVVACASYTAMSPSLLAEQSSLVVVLVQQIAALVFALVLFAGSLVVGDGVRGASSTAWASAAVAGVLYYAAAFWLYVTGLRRTTAAVAGMYINLIPLFGLVASFAILDERLSGRQVLGAAMILTAVVGIARRQLRSADAHHGSS